MSMCEHYAAPINDSGREEAYYRNLERVYTWIELLEKSWDPEPRSEPRSAPDLTDEKIKGQDFMPDPNSGLIEALATIRYMLDIDPPRRPKAQGLWENFQHVSSQKCRDCDPRHDECWKPNREQRDAVETGTARRRSMQLIPEEASDNPSTETRDGQPENENFLSANYRRDRSSLTGRRASSPHAERIQTYLSRPYNSMPEHGPPPAVASALASSSLSTEDGTRIRRISSATDGRRAYTHENPTGSRSMSPTKRRPVSESQVRYSAVQGPDSSVPLSPPKRDRSLHPPPASRNDRLPVTQDSMGSSPSLAVKKQTARSEDAGAQEKSGTNKHAYHQKQEILLPITQVIVYDLAKKLAYVTAFAQLESKVEFPLQGYLPNFLKVWFPVEIIYHGLCLDLANTLRSERKARL